MKVKTKGWSEDRRKKQADKCRREKPWQHATGPKTAEGKEISKLNGLKHGLRSQDAFALNALLRSQRHFLTAIHERLKD